MLRGVWKREINVRSQGGKVRNMAPLLRTCCGFLQLQSACKAANSRLFIRSGLNVGSNHLYIFPIVQVRELLISLYRKRIRVRMTLNRLNLSLNFQVFTFINIRVVYWLFSRLNTNASNRRFQVGVRKIVLHKNSA